MHQAIDIQLVICFLTDYQLGKFRGFKRLQPHILSLKKFNTGTHIYYPSAFWRHAGGKRDRSNRPN
jgi:hypothetical protein